MVAAGDGGYGATVAGIDMGVVGKDGAVFAAVDEGEASCQEGMDVGLGRGGKAEA